MSSSYRRWMERSSLKMKEPERNEDKGLDNKKWIQLSYS